MCIRDSLGADVYVATVVASSARSFLNFLPAIIFVVGCFLAFATGTSWGTFGILIPIVVAAVSYTHLDVYKRQGMMNAYFEIMIHDVPKEEALHYVKELNDFYTDNEPKSALARDLGDCRDNKGKLAKRVFTC